MATACQAFTASGAFPERLDATVAGCRDARSDAFAGPRAGGSIRRGSGAWRRRGGRAKYALPEPDNVEEIWGPDSRPLLLHES